MQIRVKVKPGSRQIARIEQDDDTYVAYLNARAHNGEANRSLIALASKYFRVPKTQIKIIRGEKSREKTLTLGDE